MRRYMVTLAVIAVALYAACAFAGEGGKQEAPAKKDPAQTSKDTNQKEPAVASQNKDSATKLANVNDASFKKEVLEADQPVVAVFWSPQCGPCEEVSADIASSLDGRAKVVRVNTKMSYRTQAAYRITDVPAFVLFVGGREGARATGLMSKEQLFKKLGFN